MRSPAANVGACYICQVGSPSPPTAAYFAAERLWACRAHAVDTLVLAHLRGWQGKSVFLLLAQCGCARGYCRSLLEGVHMLLRLLSFPSEGRGGAFCASHPSNHASGFPSKAAGEMVTQARTAPRLPGKVIFSCPSGTLRE